MLCFYTLNSTHITSVLTCIHHWKNPSLTFCISVLLLFLIYSPVSFFPAECILISFSHTRQYTSWVFSDIPQHASEVGEGGGRGRGREKEREREREATQLAACNTSHQPRLAGAKVSLYNKWYLTDTVFNVAVKGNVWMSLCECIYSVRKYT